MDYVGYHYNPTELMKVQAIVPGPSSCLQTKEPISWSQVGEASPEI